MARPITSNPFPAGHSQGLRLRVGELVRGVLVALTLGALSSAGLVAERISGGDTTLAVYLQLQTLALTLLAVVLLRPLAERAPARKTRALGLGGLMTAQLVAMLAGVALTHGLIIATAPSAGLRETPAQLVNDATLGAALLFLVWSVVGIGARLRLAMTVAAFLLVALYRATATLWHVDVIAFPVLTIQQFVTVEVTAVAAGLLVMDWLSPRPSVRRQR